MQSPARMDFEANSDLQLYSTISLSKSSCIRWWNMKHQYPNLPNLENPMKRVDDISLPALRWSHGKNTSHSPLDWEKTEGTSIRIKNWVLELRQEKQRAREREKRTSDDATEQNSRRRSNKREEDGRKGRKRGIRPPTIISSDESSERSKLEAQDNLFFYFLMKNKF